MTLHRKAGLLVLSACIALLSGCTVEGFVDEKDKNKQMACTDFRDGETFSYNTNNIIDIRIGVGAPTTITLVDDEGKKRTINSNMEPFLKCEAR